MSDLETPLEPAKERLSNQPGSKLKYFFPIFRFREFFSNSRDSLVGKSIISTIDQVALSATNFVVNLMLLRSLSLEDYGLFSFLFSLLLLIVSVINSIISSPMNVLVAGKSENHGNNYLASLFFAQYLLMLFLALLVLGIWILIPFTIQNELSIKILLVFIFASFGTITREFFRSLFFVKFHEIRVLFIDLIYILFYFCGLLFLIKLNVTDLLHVYFIIGCASIISGFLGVYFWWNHYWFNEISIIATLKENFHYGKWILPSNIISNLTNYSFLYLTIYMLGPAEAGILSGTRLVVMPVLLIMQAWRRVAVPKGSKFRESGRIDALSTMLTKAAFVFLLVAFIYGVIITVFRLEIINLIFRESQEMIPFILTLWLTFALVRVIRESATIGLVTLKLFKLSFVVTLIYAPFHYVLSVFLMHQFDISGALYAMIVAELILAVALWRIFLVNKKHHK